MLTEEVAGEDTGPQEERIYSFSGKSPFKNRKNT
jgi:hypothetical protein